MYYFTWNKNLEAGENKKLVWMDFLVVKKHMLFVGFVLSFHITVLFPSTTIHNKNSHIYVTIYTHVTHRWVISMKPGREHHSC